MKNSKAPMQRSTCRAFRSAKKRDGKLAQRSFGIECLEKRTVFASDLTPELKEAGVCFASPVQENSAMQITSRAVELANSDLKLAQGDIIRIELPESILRQLTDNETYELQVFYSENYFSDDAILSSLFLNQQFANPSVAVTLSQWSPPLDAPVLEPLDKQSVERATSQALQGDAFQTDVSSADRNAKRDPASNPIGAFGEYAAIVLASLTASTEFDGTVRLFDLVRDAPHQSTNRDIEGLPNEVRIEPRITVPTAMRDPGATLVKTIVVNRAASGLVLSGESSRMESDTADPSATTDVPKAPEAVTPTKNLSEQGESRTVVTLKTIDISMARRNESTRPWMRSATIANPASRRESEPKRTVSETVSDEATSSITMESESESNTQARKELRISGTHLQPVEFLLAKSIDGSDGVLGLKTERIQATDRAISEYSDTGSKEIPEIWGETVLASLSLLQSEHVPSKWLEPEKEGSIASSEPAEKTMLSSLAALSLFPIHDGVAPNRETWKNAIRSASESSAGQLMLASLTTLTVQHREINAFGTKSAWEFVTKSSPNSPVTKTK